LRFNALLLIYNLLFKEFNGGGLTVQRNFVHNQL